MSDPKPGINDLVKKNNLLRNLFSKNSGSKTKQGITLVDYEDLIKRRLHTDRSVTVLSEEYLRGHSSNAYECPVCHKSFKMKVSLKIHLKKHRKKQAHSCSKCGRQFTRWDCRILRTRTQHQKRLEDTRALAAKMRRERQLRATSPEAAFELSVCNVLSERALTDSIKELLTLLVDDATLTAFGWPDAPVGYILERIIRRCSHTPASAENIDYVGRLRENVRILFIDVIDDTAVKSLLNTRTVDDVILHVLRLAKGE